MVFLHIITTMFFSLTWSLFNCVVFNYVFLSVLTQYGEIRATTCAKTHRKNRLIRSCWDFDLVGFYSEFGTISVYFVPITCEASSEDASTLGYSKIIPYRSSMASWNVPSTPKRAPSYYIIPVLSTLGWLVGASGAFHVNLKSLAVYQCNNVTWRFPRVPSSNFLPRLLHTLIAT